MRLDARAPIVAIATPPGRGGIGIVRLSGEGVSHVALTLCHALPEPRRASLLPFHLADGQAVDQGIVLYFPAPHSYTGEDVVELQGHGGPVVLELIVERCLEIGQSIGLRLAEPGEFTERAFLHDKMDLAQAEAVADLIDASTRAAARGAARALAGEFSQAVNALVEGLIGLRMLVEATLDFPEEEIEFLEQGNARAQLAGLNGRLHALLDRTRQGALLGHGIQVVLAGPPNVGKSSLLNALAGDDVAIVTPVPGTTRDRIERVIELQGVALNIIDTAGLRETNDPVEAIGIERTLAALATADLVLWMKDALDPGAADGAAGWQARLPPDVPVLHVLNKIDAAVPHPPAGVVSEGRVNVSAKTGKGLSALAAELLRMAGWHSSAETVFVARQRHVQALNVALQRLEQAALHAKVGDRELDLMAENLRQAQEALNRITGEFTADDLLGEIFAGFCIGK